MSAVVDFTTIDDIRAVLGVSSNDLEDATVSLDVYAFNLVTELEDLDPDLQSTYEALIDTDIENMSTAETRFYRSTRMFATYSVARQLCGALPMFAPKEHSDGKGSVTRFQQDPFKEVVKNVERQYEKAVNRLTEAFATLTTTSAPITTTRVMLVGASLGTDPVTGS